MANDNPSFVLKSIGNFAYESRPVPDLKSPTDVLIAVKQTGICGSDVHYWTHGAIGSFIVKAPIVLGHESAGVVVRVGDGVTSVKPGDRCALEPGIACRSCVRCKEGRYNLCPDMRFAATPPYDGTLAKYYVLPQDFCYKLPETVSLEEGALIEPAAVAVHVCKQVDVRPGSTMVVFGAGPVGLLCCAVAKAFGATRVVSVDINEERLEFAKKYAATEGFMSKRGESAEEAGRRLVEEGDFGAGVDKAIDASGAEYCIQMAMHALRPGGSFCQAGMGKPEITFPITTMCVKELNIKGSFRYAEDDYRLAIQLVASDRLDVKPLISKKVSFKEAEDAFKDVNAAKGIKILIAGPEE
ncbi:putative xylitol dehydrogenase [Eremomyces bilateralis CBS 781.70]|uniref:D-xylulose reductase n=1 Tax=Eremomyces bilateralis CBS 781.70 TaxID=1392243 RepID=A0A6G1G858_9PEZI|nr:putative xylitol dehydrogenase [Eremomyces bilateralis CBS 781.70]KAF1814080.1 putative xylitol dehydrogenase [Eremomyces bilateralis CBS 781.70]